MDDTTATHPVATDTAPDTTAPDTTGSDTTTNDITAPDTTGPDTTAATDRPAPQIWPGLRYRDAPAALEYLSSVLGFRVVVAYRSPADDSIVEHAQLEWPEGGGIMIGSHRESPEWPARPGTGTNYVVTDRAAEVYERVRAAAGFEVLQELAADPYGGGGESLGVRDPEGNLWSFGSYRGEPG